MTLEHCVLTSFPITPPWAISQNILLEPLPLAPPRVGNWTLWGAQRAIVEQIRRVSQRMKMKSSRYHETTVSVRIWARPCGSISDFSCLPARVLLTYL